MYLRLADKKYSIDFEMADGTIQSVEFTVPEGPPGPPGPVYELTETDRNAIVGRAAGRVAGIVGQGLVLLKGSADGASNSNPIYYLEVGKEYLGIDGGILEGEASKYYSFSLRIKVRNNKWIYVLSQPKMPDVDEIFFTIKVLGIEDSIVTYEYCGETCTFDGLASTLGAGINTIDAIELRFDYDFYRVSDIAKSAYEIAVKYGFEGTEQEFADGLDPDKIIDKVLDRLEQAEDKSV